MSKMHPSNGTQATEERIAPSRVDGEALRARVDSMAAEAQGIDEELRARIGRWHSTCADCSD